MERAPVSLGVPGGREQPARRPCRSRAGADAPRDPRRRGTALDLGAAHLRGRHVAGGVRAPFARKVGMPPMQVPAGVADGVAEGPASSRASCASRGGREGRLSAGERVQHGVRAAGGSVAKGVRAPRGVTGHRGEGWARGEPSPASPWRSDLYLAVAGAREQVGVAGDSPPCAPAPRGRVRGPARGRSRPGALPATPGSP